MVNELRDVYSPSAYLRAYHSNVLIPNNNNNEQ